MVYTSGIAAFFNFLAVILGSSGAKAASGFSTTAIKDVTDDAGVGVGAVAFIFALIAVGANVGSHIIGSNNWRAALCRSGPPLQSIAVSNPASLHAPPAEQQQMP